MLHDFRAPVCTLTHAAWPSFAVCGCADPRYLDLAACTERCMPSVGRIARDMKRRRPVAGAGDPLQASAA